MIFDNLKIAQNRKIQNLLKADHNNHLLFCSQDNKGLSHTIKVGHLSQFESSIILDKIMPDHTKEDKKTINSFAKGFPLLVSQIGFLLKDNNHLTPKDYKNHLLGQQKTVEEQLNIVLDNLSNSAKNLLFKLALIDNSFSRDCINKVAPNAKIEDIQELIRFGLIKNIRAMNNFAVFEMQNVVKGYLLQNVTEVKIREKIEELILSIHTNLPKRSLKRYKLFLKDNTILNAIEKLEKEALQYNVSFSNTLILTRHRLVFHVFSRNYISLNEIQNWFVLEDKKRNYGKHDNQLKLVSYAECMFMMGLNELIYKVNLEQGYKQLNAASLLLENIEGEENLKISIYGQLARYYLDTGDINNANYKLRQMFILKEGFPDIELGLRLYYLTKSKVLLNSALYKDALKTIENCIEKEEYKSLENNTFLAGTYLIKAKILNRMKQYKMAHVIAKKIYNQQNFKIHDDIIPLALIELSNSVLGMGGDQEKALEYAGLAKDILVKNKIRNKNILNSTDAYLADSIVAKANALASKGSYEKALEEYIVADIIYYNKYKLNIKNVDDVSYLYFNAALSCKNLANQMWFLKYLNKHIKYFGFNNPRSIELKSL